MANENARRFSNEFWLTILIFAVTIAFSAGASLMAFETKADSTKKSEDMKTYIDKTFMPRELSTEKWITNEKSHEEIKKTLEAILKELRHADEVQAAKPNNRRTP